MTPIIFCERCRGMAVGWNRKYLIHRVVCRRFSRSFKVFLAVAAVVGGVLSIFPASTAVLPPDFTTVVNPLPEPSPMAVVDASSAPVRKVSDATELSIDAFLAKNSRLGASERARVARAVVASARKYDVDPFLISSVLLVESSGDPFAISGRDAVGLMQIHVPTWGDLIEAEQINLFLVEDNVDLGTRILREYTLQHGLWDGVMRYLGAGEPTEAALEYVSRIQGIYGDRTGD